MARHIKRGIKLTAAQVEEIKRLASETDLSSSQIASQFPVTAGHVRKILSGQTWKSDHDQ